MTIENLEAELRRTPEPTASRIDSFPLIKAAQDAIINYEKVIVNPDAEIGHRLLAENAVERSIKNLHRAGYPDTATLFLEKYKAASQPLVTH